MSLAILERIIDLDDSLSSNKVVFSKFILFISPSSFGFELNH